MMQGITTKYRGPTNTRGSQVHALARKAERYSNGDSFPAMQLTDAWSHADGVEKNHCRVAQLLAVKLDWSGVWIGGGAPDGAGYMFVNLGRIDRATALASGMVDERLEGADWFAVAPKTEA